MNTVLNMPRFLLDDARAVRDPYPVYRRLRAYGPVCRGGPGQWVFPRHEEVSALLRDPRLGREFPEEYQAVSVGEGPANDYLRRIVVDRDRPDHTRLRRLLTKSLSPAMIRGLREPIALLVDGLLDQFAEERRFDLVRDLAVPVPMMVMSELLDIPRADRDDIARLSTSLAQAFAVFISEDKRREAHGAVVELREYMAGLVRERRRRPGEDLLSRMLTAVKDGEEPLTDEEIIDNALFVYYAGFETTTNAIATGGDLLVHQPHTQRQLRADPGIVGSALEEFMRYDAPIHATTRLAVEPIEIAGLTVRKGRVVVLLLASANHDERVFHDPARADLTRSPNPHLSFGGGIHHCLGAALARVEGAVVFERLAARFADIESAGEGVWEPSEGGFRFPYWAHRSLPVAVRPA
ncbi:cytochrome P450 [Streptomyces sp. NPDC012389]|uniref:cytochrome P450 n=1 Tax=unclassified Streptomyces TaxID=2593676 RepID=UPI00081EF39F|nr:MULTISPECIES: cytochrome P450 [unclassified Streptomyces]MYR94584.1 cytochrome P450 [Streptomyces sp. SID4937]MYX18051.1 cytochrome P450 [Streptomyces sp. SID8374]SCD73944.1 Cytochrome P450 [Streptomyces sp. ScaeMP-e83]